MRFECGTSPGHFLFGSTQDEEIASLQAQLQREGSSAAGLEPSDSAGEVWRTPAASAPTAELELPTPPTLPAGVIADYKKQVGSLPDLD